MQGVSSLEDQDQFADSQNSQVPDFTLNDLAILKVLLCEFEKAIDQTNAGSSTIIKDGQFLYDVLQKVQHLLLLATHVLHNFLLITFT